MIRKRFLKYAVLINIIIIISSCNRTIPWPESPLYDLSKYKNDSSSISNIDSIKKQLIGHYAHYDVVSYEDTTTRSPMFTFIISYGFTDFFLDSLGNIIQSDKFVRASHKINQKNITSFFSDNAVQAIKPRSQIVEISKKDGKCHVFRPPTPYLLGIEGDPSKPLSRDREDPNLTDPDADGNPGVTVEINIAKIISGEIYITRREIYSNYLTINNDGTLIGFIKDDSEQFVLGASLSILDQASNNIQHPSVGMNPIILVPIDAEIDTLEELMEIRDDIFPKEPDFF
ncbi:MAG: hypothetical protein C0598_07175 [Marinilabiliales bacterium]|nr:MAG: hypothetical protein C0598_07175 [Marinilabiliales bacterium]